MNAKFGFGAALVALAVMMTGAVSGTAAPDPDSGTAIMNPKPAGATRTIQSGESVTLKRGESVRVMLPKAKPFVAQAPARNDEQRLAEWLNGRKGLTFADVQAFIAAEKLMIPADFLTEIQRTLEEAGVKPGPSSNPGITRRNFVRSYYEIESWYTMDAGECGYAMGTVGSGRNGGRRTDSVTVQVERSISNSANMKVGTTLAAISAEVGFDVTESLAISTSITEDNVEPGGVVRVLGWRMGDCVTYMYDRVKYNVYWDTVDWQFVTVRASEVWYRGTAFQARWMHLETR